jgi:shikimate dehydrogenase
MHNAALAELGLGDEWSYEAIEVDADGFGPLVGSLPEQGFAGVNVTVPYKLAALALADEASAAAREIGAANTLTFAGGRIAAENTDAPGLIAALPEPPAGRRALVLGAGGSARAVVWALRRAGAEVAIWNRTASRGEALAAELGARTVTDTDLADFDLVVNATTVGMDVASGGSGPQLKALPLDVDALQARHMVVDLVYGAVETPLVSAARERGIGTVDGLEVLVRQGAESLRLWTGLDPPLETMRTAARRNAQS